MDDLLNKDFILPINTSNLEAEFSDDYYKHRKRISKLSEYKTRTISFVNWAKANGEVNDFTLLHYSTSIPLLDKLYCCHSDLVFRHYLETGKIKLHQAKHCDIHLLCPLCAIRRASKKLKIYKEKTDILLEQHDNKVFMYMLTLTVLDGLVLKEVYNHITKSIKTLMSRRRDCIRAKSGAKKYAYALNSMFANVIAGVYSTEIKKGKNSNIWHPHIHLLIISDRIIDYSDAIQEWKDITLDSCNIHFDPITPENMDTSFVEVFKYALKFSDMPFKDNYEAFQAIRGKRLLGSFGAFRGLETVEIDESEEDLQNFVELLYKYDYSNKKYNKMEAF